MGWFARINENRHLGRYARLLYPKLKQLYGGGKHFTEAQIRRAAEEARLNPTFISFGFAMFLPKDDYQRLHPDVQPRDYERRRTAIAAVLGYDAAVLGALDSWDFAGGSDGGVGGDGGGAGDAGGGGDGG